VLLKSDLDVQQTHLWGGWSKLQLIARRLVNLGLKKVIKFEERGLIQNTSILFSPQNDTMSLRAIQHLYISLIQMIQKMKCENSPIGMCVFVL
jgi:hypothetical protein